MKAAGDASAAPDILRALEALAEPSRLRLLRLLDREEMSVGELAECTGLPQSSVSRHLAALRAAGFVEERAEGVRTLVRRASTPPVSTAALIAPVLDAVRAGDFGHDEDLSALERLRRARTADREALFDSLAGDWDALREELLGGRPGAAELGALFLPRGLRIVDAGTGTGVHLPWLAELAGPEGLVVGVERSGAMAVRARERAKGLANVEVRRGRIEDLPVDDAWADVVLLSLSLGHVDDAEVALRRCARALRPGGRLVVADVERHADAALVARLGPGFRGFDAAELLATMTRAGLEGPRRVVFAGMHSRSDEGAARVARRRNITPLTPLFCVGTAPERGGRTGDRTRRKP
ncbi:MAG: metalloregulator ArsR/SmtB family transcription factor [Planctomycetes bacterium]|nr:metalloregulator ArsR/SmtB family transcription factor [Planctomycetota bacterium]